MTSWKQKQRQQLLAAREALAVEEREQIQTRCLGYVSDFLEQCEPGIISLYWPIKGELDCRPLAAKLMTAGWTLTVPVINKASKQLEFAHWQPDTPMQTGTWNIPVPVKPVLLQPDRLLVPLVGFDQHNYRLGYGGGYYDRTLAAIKRPVKTVGMGMELGRFDSIAPQPHDIPMDYIITEKGLQPSAGSGL